MALRSRVIPVLLLKSGNLIRSAAFRTHQSVGDPFHDVTRYGEWDVDELIYLRIRSTEERYDARPDTKNRRSMTDLGILNEVARRTLVPLTWGGGLRVFDDAVRTIHNGADKVYFNTACQIASKEVTKTADHYGRQAVVGGIDVTGDGGSPTQVWTHAGSQPVDDDLADYAKRLEQMGVGEILLQSITNDGKAHGFDLSSIETVANSVDVPIIALGGAGSPSHFVDAVNAGASAVAAANYFHFVEDASNKIKTEMAQAGIDVRRTN